jgi:ATP phosphoribosyltransferase
LNCSNGRKPLSLVLPTGSMENAVMELFEEADMKIDRNGDRGYDGSVNFNLIKSIKFLRPQDIPRYVAAGIFDLGISGQDWVRENLLQNVIHEICTLPLTKSGVGFARIVLCVSDGSDIHTAMDIPTDSEIETEYLEITADYFKTLGKKVKISLSHGCTEAKVPLICPAVTELTETGTTLKKNNLREIAELFKTTACLITSKETSKDKEKMNSMRLIEKILKGVVAGRGKVMLKFHMPTDQLSNLATIIPGTKTPTINDLDDQLEGSSTKMKNPTISRLKNSSEVAVEIIVSKVCTENESGVNMLIPQLEALGATGFVEFKVGKWIS